MKPPPDDLIVEIAAAEAALRDALTDLKERLDADQHGAATDELAQHCREMAEILRDAVDQLGTGIDEEATRAAASLLADSLVTLERDITRRSIH